MVLLAAREIAFMSHITLDQPMSGSDVDFMSLMFVITTKFFYQTRKKTICHYIKKKRGE
jgi:hypothetical protein